MQPDTSWASGPAFNQLTLFMLRIGLKCCFFGIACNYFQPLKLSQIDILPNESDETRTVSKETHKSRMTIVIEVLCLASTSAIRSGILN